MKWIKDIRDWVAFVIAVFGIVMLGDASTRWLSLFGWTTDVISGPLIYVLKMIASAVWMACLFWAAYLLLRALLSLAAAALVRVHFLIIRFRRWLGMAIVDREAALRVIQNSDFFQSRQPQAKRNMGAFATLDSLRGHFVGETQRDAMLRKHFVRLVLNAFEEQRSSACSDEGYDADVLNGWLDELFEDEVIKEMGGIPRV